MIKKAGQIIPRHIVRITPRKCQHMAKFGCDVEMHHKNIKAITDGPIIEINRGFILSKNKKVRRYFSVVIEGLRITGMTNGSVAYKGDYQIK